MNLQTAWKSLIKKMSKLKRSKRKRMIQKTLCRSHRVLQMNQSLLQLQNRSKRFRRNRFQNIQFKRRKKFARNANSLEQNLQSKENLEDYLYRNQPHLSRDIWTSIQIQKKKKLQIKENQIRQKKTQIK